MPQPLQPLAKVSEDRIREFDEDEEGDEGEAGDQPDVDGPSDGALGEPYRALVVGYREA